MQCGTCNHWVHAKCEDLTGNFIFISCKGRKKNSNFLLKTFAGKIPFLIRKDDEIKHSLYLSLWNSQIFPDELYEILSSLPESVVYSCRPCSVTQPSAWRELLYIELRAGVEKVLACLLSSTLTQHLVTCSQVWESPGQTDYQDLIVICYFIQILMHYIKYIDIFFFDQVWKGGWSWHQIRRTTSLWPAGCWEEVWQRPLHLIGEHPESLIILTFISYTVLVLLHTTSDGSFRITYVIEM